jgi:hypothetical protein
LPPGLVAIALGALLVTVLRWFASLLRTRSTCFFAGPVSATEGVEGRISHPNSRLYMLPGPSSSWAAIDTRAVYASGKVNRPHLSLGLSEGTPVFRKIWSTAIPGFYISQVFGWEMRGKPPR